MIPSDTDMIHMDNNLPIRRECGEEKREGE
jgi:hypothetical protein